MIFRNVLSPVLPAWAAFLERVRVWASFQRPIVSTVASDQLLPVLTESLLIWIPPCIAEDDHDHPHYPEESRDNPVSNFAPFRVCAELKAKTSIDNTQRYDDSSKPYVSTGPECPNMVLLVQEMMHYQIFELAIPMSDELSPVSHLLWTELSSGSSR